MGRRQTDSELGRSALLILFLMGTVSCLVVYLCISMLLKPTTNTTSTTSTDASTISLGSNLVENGEEEGECCRGIDHLELWGEAVKWGSEFKVKSAEECCVACKGMCRGVDGPCLCDSWVFCGDRDACGSRFGECWLKKQKDTLDPDRRDSGDQVIWTSGVIFEKGKGIVGLETEHGLLRIKLFPDCAPYSVSYILELLALRHCAGCHFYRAERRGSSWDPEGNHVENAPFGPPFALIQGTLEALETPFNDIPTEACPTIRRGSIAWVGSGPEFFISLANHHEWKKAYTVFGSVLPEDMEIAEKIAELPITTEVWKNINVSVLENHVQLHFRRINMNMGEH